MDWSKYIELIWDARWDGIVMVFHQVLIAAMTHWWIGPTFVLLILTARPRARRRFLRAITMTYWRSHSSD